jgi:hypothetical protein
VNDTPHRAFELIVEIGADTKEALIAEVENFARRIARNDISHGVICGSDSGAIYSYVERPEQTHDVYFTQLTDLLERTRTILAGNFLAENGDGAAR